MKKIQKGAIHLTLTIQSLPYQMAFYVHYTYMTAANTDLMTFLFVFICAAKVFQQGLDLDQEPTQLSIQEVNMELNTHTYTQTEN